MIERLERPGPIGGRAAIFEYGLPRPGDRRPQLRRFFRRATRCLEIVAPLRLDIKSAQSQARVSSRAVIARKARSAPLRSPASCADCALSSNANGSRGDRRAASSADFRAALKSPAPIAIKPRVTAR